MSTDPIREALEFAAVTLSSDWPARCQEIVRRARAALSAPEPVAPDWMPFAITVAAALDRGDDPHLLFDENSTIRDELRTLIAAQRAFTLRSSARNS